MAFKMKNPSMAKLTKAAGDNRAATKMKMESAAKMKQEAAMKMKKESMAKLTEKASAMKKDERSLLQRAKDEAKQIGKGIKGAVLQSDYLLSREGMLDRRGGKKQAGVIQAFKEDYKKEEDKQAAKRKGSAKKKSATKLKKKDSATKFNAELKAASKAGKLSGKFKEAVDASPTKLKDGNKKAKLQAELDKVNDKIEAAMRTKDVNTLMDARAKKVAERRGLTRTQIIEGYLSPLQDKKDSLRNEINKIK